ncbi:hypothetical protein ASE98_13290 [Pseudomonas sp. Leaf48]|nr:hypothetical protein ASE98_13290 [Pseudomonas sp. Leaf48]
MARGFDTRELVERTISDHEILTGMLVETVGGYCTNPDLKHITATVNEQVKIPMGHVHDSSENDPVAFIVSHEVSATAREIDPIRRKPFDHGRC